MSLPACLPTAIIETILLHLASLFLAGANGDADAARRAALHMLTGFAPRNERELCLAAEIISFDLHALEALSKSDEADMPITRVMRLRSGAVSLNREAHRARHELRQMQQSTPEAPPEAPQASATEPRAATPGRVRAEAAVEFVEEARKMIETAGKNAQQGRYGGMTYSQALAKRATAQRMVETQKRRAAEHTARLGLAGAETALEAAPA
jgi:hypothetical protein